MTSTDRPANRRAVFERDGFACRHCGGESTDGRDSAGTEADAVRAYRVGPESAVDGPVHEDLLVTVCADCYRTLHPEHEERFDGTGAVSPAVLFETVREFTREQGGAVSTVAAFASVATGLPETVESGDGPSFQAARREAVLAVDVADARLGRLRSLRERTDGESEPAFERFLASATALQAELRAVLELGDAVPAALGRCRGCFDDSDGDDDDSVENGDDVAAFDDSAEIPDGHEGACSTCGCERPALEEWREGDEIRFDRLFAAISDALEGASDRTEELTDRSLALAESLADT